MSERSASTQIVDSPVIPSEQPAMVILTGQRQMGKTTICRRLATEAKQKGWDVAGLLSPAVFENGRKTGIEAIDPRSGQKRRLATVHTNPEPGQLGYRFDDDVLSWADGVIASAVPCDLLIVDELGPLEILRGEGLTSAFEVLRGERFRLAIVVVRPELVSAFRARLPRFSALVTVSDLSELVVNERTASLSSKACTGDRS